MPFVATLLAVGVAADYNFDDEDNAPDKEYRIAELPDGKSSCWHH
jgi:hypothetical protein